MPLGHEPAGEVVEIGGDVTGISVGDHVVINPMAAPSGIIGNGGATGALADYLLIEHAVRGKSLEVVANHIPFEVAALNEPMAVARHGVNQVAPKPSDKVAVFGAGPIGLGATMGFKSVGVQHVTVVDLIPSRVEKALQVGADAIINSADEDVARRLIELHGAGESIFEVTKDIIANWEKYDVIVSHTVPFDDVEEALQIAATPVAADKVVVTFN
jgi:threonine dehydrogenase-like Zn-dependent dehydrogenase